MRHLGSILPCLLIVFSIVGMQPTFSSAQDDRAPRFDARVIVGIPQGQASDQMGSGGGLGGSVMVPLNDKPVQLGFDVGLLSFGSTGSAIPTSSALLTGHAVFRLQSADGTFRPFADLLLGTNHAFSSTTLAGGAGTYSTSDFGIGYGFGAGVDITIIDGDSDFLLNNLEFTGGLRVLGSSLSYSPGLPAVGGGAVGSQSYGSFMLVPQLGVTTEF